MSSHVQPAPAIRTQPRRRSDVVLSVGPVQITRDRRLFIGPHRIHHGLFGLLLLVHDIRDVRSWVRDFIRWDQGV